MKNIILDTDIGPDCDDAGAIALLNIFANKGLCRILGIGHCTSNPYGAGAVDVICRYYGNKCVNIGTTQRKAFLCREKDMSYNRTLCRNFENRFTSEKPEEVVSMYRRLLENSEDNSVTFVAIGPLNNLSDLLDSPPDTISPYSGKALVKNKVKELVLMAGIFPPEKEYEEALLANINAEIENYPEFNVVCDTKAAENVSGNWQTPKICLGYEAGLFKTGFTDKNDLNPVNLAYRLYTDSREKANAMRESWDLFTVFYAVNPTSDLFKLSKKGTVSFTEKGFTRWHEHPCGTDAYILHAKTPQATVNAVNSLLNSK